MSRRNERFVRTAKRLLLVQAGAAALAVGVAGWAALEVAGLVRERDDLTARVAELEQAQRMATSFGAYVDPGPLPPAPPATVPPASGTDAAPKPGTSATPPAPPPSSSSDATPIPPPPPAPPAPSPPAPPPPSPPPAPPAPPAPRECQSVEGRAIVCVPPFRRTPAPGVCVDGNNRPVRCPRRVREPEPPKDPDQQQPLTRR